MGLIKPNMQIRSRQLGLGERKGKRIKKKQLGELVTSTGAFIDSAFPWHKELGLQRWTKQLVH
ncbi:uncharacterized protein G2W53_041887 [Senna tora]|uniref:Uncharacterized protein n=1 Tax=Senna tora TaxID=362788 RepID=A0A834W1V3_9FABA|nr:uncharacterized protein G2W53_041887 [Senna tora]